MAKIFRDTSRALIRVEGTDRTDFLQGLVTSDVALAAPDRAVWAALLTPQGKYLFDFFVFAAPDGEALVLDAAADRAAVLVSRLSLYRLRRDVRIGAPEPIEVALVWDVAEGAEPPGRAVPDPRHPRLGWRCYGDAPEGEAVGRDAYDALRVELLVPESGAELLPEESFILEHGLADLGGVDFRKGCYVGQEVTARMRHKTSLKKRLVRVTVDGEAEPGTEVLTAEGKPAGRLGTRAGDLALAHLRLDRAAGLLTAGAAKLHYLDEESAE